MSLFSRIRNLFRRSTGDMDVQEELQSHIDQPVFNIATR